MIVAEQLTKRYGDKLAVDNVSFTVPPGKVTGFLGPNGAGKSTTMRMIVGLDRPTAGRVTVNGARYQSMRAPLTEVGVLLDAKAVHTGRSARNHLRAIAATHGFGRARVDEVIELTGIASVAGRRAGTFSLGMGQRLGIATALLGDPHTLILDEPVNGLDPEGVRWVRQFVRYVAGDLPDLVREWTSTAVTVRSPRLTELISEIEGSEVTVTSNEPELATITGLTAARIGDLAAARGIPLHELTPHAGSLEDAYLALTGEAVEYRTKEIA